MDTEENKKPDTREEIIPLPENQQTKGLKLTLENLKSESSSLKLLMAGVVIVLFIGFITILMSSASILLDDWRFHASSYNEFMQTLKTQEKIIQNYTDEQKTTLETIQRIENDLKIIKEKLQK